ncbi:MAG: tRNA-specific adenosine deaminase [Candidatus Fluviicola riflensis]|nr:MAG: tRNA-specific adenosine deaminase [Candidatus Fluviicola riflensis]OGS77997.1 MAG: tRNA-specific adenosine deaminase [Candidatus Fluviicola riflensis]OGS85062.1 MAG: tRNA-specific adenosine deaminase [Fluviicola sp. RIFCSPHIGHO2_01_FULL_43_53]OGS89334.1 MAG: tRNA-specific adenosine deaminase [Fluviicola sp. RIFCSPHIGHO2_12_FULL_43_24]
MISPYNDDYFMRQAYQEALKAYDLGEVPVGAVVVVNQQVIARAHNLTERLTDVTAHAEMQAITAASEFLGGKYLKGCTLYVTLEPCVMCAGALYWSQIDKIVFAARDEKRGAGRFDNQLYHPKTVVQNGNMHEECRELMQRFFVAKR